MTILERMASQPDLQSVHKADTDREAITPYLPRSVTGQVGSSKRFPAGSEQLKIALTTSMTA